MDNTRKKKARDFLIARGKNFHPNFTIDRQNGRVALQLLKYFSGDKSFEEELDCNGKPMTFEKGIYLSAPVGVGKTWLMEAFSNRGGIEAMLNGFYNHTCQGIVNEFNEKGPITLSPHFTEKRCYQDLGSETMGSHYGRVNVMYQIIMTRYDNNVITHYTSNHGNGADIDKIYGEARISSRLRETCNFIVLEGSDRRK